MQLEWTGDLGEQYVPACFGLSKSFLTLDVKVLNRIKFDIACTRLGGC